MAAAGAQIVGDSEELAVMGITEVVRALPRIRRARGAIFDHLDSQRPDLVIPIDFPGFNGGLAGRAGRLGIPVYWIIAPQVWAWGGWRIGGYRRKIDRLATILPFEEDFFTRHGFDVYPMGHPLMEDYAGDFPFSESLNRREKVLNSRNEPLTVAVIPGSRQQELRELLAILKVTGQAMIGSLEQRDVRLLVSCAPGVDPRQLAEVFDKGCEISQIPLPELLPRADLALVCSGTASLEAALAGVPHELVYRTGSFNYFLAKRLLRTEFIGLSNLIMGKEIVRENLQEQAAPLPLARNLMRWMARPAERQTFYASVRRLRQMCGSTGVWDRAARDVLNFLAGRDAPSGRSGR